MNESKVNCDVEGLIAVIERIGGGAVDGASKALGEGANEIQWRAMNYAPVDTEDLENSISIDVDGRDAKGRFKRKTFYVFIDESKLKNKDYATIMHEELAPYGSGTYKLGPKSQAKDAGSGNVGGKFLERASDELEDHIVREVEYMIERTFR